MGILEAVIAGLIVAGVSAGVGMILGKNRERNRFKQRHEAAVKQFAGELKKLIDTADPQADDAITTARAIVSVRNSLRKVLTSVSESLNSDIDVLQELVAQPDIERIRQSAIRERLAILKKTWPSKEVELDVAVRKVITEFGLEPDSN